MNFRFIFPAIVYSVFFLQACQDKKETRAPKESPVSGRIRILSDESFKPIIDAEVDIFQALYKDANIETVYLPENIAFDSLFQDKDEMIITGRPLTEEEKRYFEEQQARINELHFATDAVAFILPDRFNNSLISASDLQSIFSGNFKTWKDVNKTWPDEKISIVVDQSNSSNLLFTKKYFDLEPSNVQIYAAGSNMEVVSYTKSHNNAIGIIGSAWISDEESANSKKLREGLSILSLTGNDSLIFTPFQGSVATVANPLSRKIYIIRRNKNTGLSAGFTSFLMSARGQRIVLKSGAVPAIIPGREIIIN